MAKGKGGYNVEVGMDLSPFDQGVAALKAGGQRIAGALGSAKAAVGGLVDRIFSLKTAITGVLAGGVAYKLTDWTRGFVRLSTEASDAAAGLADQLHSTGQYTAGSVEDLRAYASERQKVTKFDDDGTVAMMANLATYQMSAAEIKRVTGLVQDLATAKRMDLVTASDLVGKAFQGETGTLSRYGIIIDDNLSATQKYEAVVQKLSATFGGRAQAAATTFSGRLAQMGNRWDDLKQAVGDFITESDAMGRILDYLAQKLTDLENWLAANEDAVRDWIDNGIAVAGRWMRSLFESVQAFLTNDLGNWLHRIAIGFNAVKLIGQLAWGGVRLAIVGAIEAARLFSDIMAAGEGVFVKVFRKLYGITEEELKGGFATESFWGGVSDKLKTMRESAIDDAEASGRAIQKTWDTMMSHASKVGAGGGAKWGAGGGGDWDAEAEREKLHRKETRSLRSNLADQDTARADAARQAKLRVADLGSYVEKAYKKETDKLFDELDRQIDKRKDALAQVKKLNEQMLDSVAGYRERVFGLLTKDLKGDRMAREQEKMARWFAQRGQGLVKAGDFEAGRKDLEKSLDYAGRAWEESSSRGAKLRLAGAMRKIQAEIERGIADQKAKAQADANLAQLSIDQLIGKMHELQDQVTRQLALNTNFPEVASQVDAIRQKLDEIKDKFVTITVKYAEQHAAGGWVGGGTPGRDSVHALLTPGEFVVNARAAAMNRALLERVNAGFAVPARFAQGGHVGGRSVADQRTVVNVTFNGPGDRQYIRQVVIPGIQQAVRRGRAGRLAGATA